MKEDIIPSVEGLSRAKKLRGKRCLSRPIHIIPPQPLEFGLNRIYTISSSILGTFGLRLNYTWLSSLQNADLETSWHPQLCEPIPQSISFYIQLVLFIWNSKADGLKFTAASGGKETIAKKQVLFYSQN